MTRTEWNESEMERREWSHFGAGAKKSVGTSTAELMTFSGAPGQVHQLKELTVEMTFRNGTAGKVLLGMLYWAFANKAVTLPQLDFNDSRRIWAPKPVTSVSERPAYVTMHWPKVSLTEEDQLRLVFNGSAGTDSGWVCVVSTHAMIKIQDRVA